MAVRNVNVYPFEVEDEPNDRGLDLRNAPQDNAERREEALERPATLYLNKDLGVQGNADRIREHLITTGQMAGLQDRVFRQLIAVGWNIEMKRRCREEILKHEPSVIPLEELYEKLKEVGRETVPDAIKEDIIQKMKYCCESSISSGRT